MTDFRNPVRLEYNPSEGRYQLCEPHDLDSGSEWHVLTHVGDRLAQDFIDFMYDKYDADQPETAALASIHLQNFLNQ